MAPLSEEDKKVVKRWWKCSAKIIYQRGYTLNGKYCPSLTPSHLPVTCRSFQEIVNAGTVISVTAKRKVDKRVVKLTIVKALRGTGDEGNVQLGDQNATFFDVHSNRGSHTLMVTLDHTPPQPLWKRLFSFWSTKERGKATEITGTRHGSKGEIAQAFDGRYAEFQTLFQTLESVGEGTAPNGHPVMVATSFFGSRDKHLAELPARPNPTLHIHAGKNSTHIVLHGVDFADYNLAWQ
ncbi:hypothetical protein V8E53_001368 [Lactarius tabidus]